MTPSTPPATPVGEKAPVTIALMAPGTCSMLTAITTAHPST
nr:hypothetical protein [Rhodococcus sp. SORGH_AS_0301]